MSVQMKVIEFEQHEAHLSSELDSGPPYTVHGVALGEDDVTRGASGVKKKWPADELKQAASTLEGTNLVVDHDNDASGVVGKVTKAGYKEGVGVLYEADLYEDELAEKIANGLLEVSVRGYHIDVDEMSLDEETGAKVVEDIKFDNLSIVPTGASPSNTLNMGEHAELSAAELSQYVETMDYAAALQEDGEIEPGMWVKSNGTKGITISQVQDGEIEVDVYEKSNGKWRSTGETKMLDVESLSEWDVDEEEDIGAVENEEEEDGDEEENAAAELQAMHEPEWDSTADKEWSAPNLEDFLEEMDTDAESWEDLSGDQREAISNHFLVSTTGEFPPERFSDLALPVVEVDGTLNLNALTAAKARAGQVETVAQEDEARLNEMINSLANENFEDATFGDTEEAAKHHHEATAEMITEFLEVEGNSQETLVSAFLEWADDENARQAVNEFVEMTDHDLESSVGDLEEWLDSVLTQDDEAEMAEGEGAEKEGKQGKQNQPWRFPDEDGDRSPDEPDDADFEENTDAASLQDWEFHEPSWDGTTEDEWSAPDMEDFDTDDLGEIADHFLVSATGFPPENFTDLALPVVEPNGNLNVNALAAVKGGRGASAVEGLSDEMDDRITEWVNETANEEFDRNWGEEENAATQRDVPSQSANPTHKMDPDVEDDHESEQMNPVDTSLELINFFLRANGKDERDSVDKMLGWLFSSTDVPTMKMEAFRTAANAFLDAQGGADSFSAVDVESFRDWLLTQGGQTDDGVNARDTVPKIATPVHVLSGDDLGQALTVMRASKKDDSQNTTNTTMTDIEAELAELDEPVAVEKEDFESLQEKADRMDEMSETLASLQERTDVLDSVDREQVEELAESEDPVVLESSEYEALSDEAEQVKQVYAEALSDEGPFTADDLTDKFSIEELREKYEDAGHDIEEELNPAPKGNDPSEEELEQKAEEENKSEEELAEEDEIQQKQAELREKILGN